MSSVLEEYAEKHSIKEERNNRFSAESCGFEVKSLQKHSSLFIKKNITINILLKNISVFLANSSNIKTFSTRFEK